MKFKLTKNNIEEAIKEMQSIQDILRWTTTQFNCADLYYGQGTDNSWDEALQLILPSLFLSINFPVELYSSHVLINERSLIINRVSQRINERIPISYLTNKSWFCGLEFYVNENVLIPRSPIGELITNRFHNLLPNIPLSILDMCTGSGCIGIACSYAFPQAKVDAVDISITALDVAKHNINIHNLENKVTTICSDLFCDLPPCVYDLIVVNPPYVNAQDIKNMPTEFYAEPILALNGGSDGLNLIRRILTCVIDYLSEDGILICEVGNSMTNLILQYPKIPFRWLTFINGGDGVFMLTRKQLQLYYHLIYNG